MSSPGMAPRRAAIDILDAIQNDGKLLNELLPKSVEHLPPAERARAGRLALSTLRWMDRADRILGPFLQQRPPLRAHNILRLGIVELFVDQAAAHGVVNTSVDLARSNQETLRTAGMINAILRKVSQLPAEKWSELPAPQLPKWLRKQLVKDFGKAEIAAIEAAHAAGAPLDITVKSDPEKWAETLDGELLASGSIRLHRNVQVTELPGFQSGDWWVQDAAAAMPAKLLNVSKGERVLDLCAAPGGKTMQFCAAGAEVTALDASPKRLERLEQNLVRTNLTAKIVAADALEYEAPAFDAILLDAPCSATGTIRRHPDLPYAKTSEDFPTLFALQEKMIDRALALLKPGGRLVYCTCSLLIDEGEEQIRDAMARNPKLTIDQVAMDQPWLPAEWHVKEGVRTRPDYWADKGGMDGFFMTVLKKPG